ncbi:TIGR03986 family type III CRISPR-associated RAMP protein [Virgibacillus chiguensis]|uniref:CRISPR-associated protein n=1 Tax=Virgibacillus chiguensis TaxID=411959 RepID=A0A1M5T9R5_9BACI|nr:TIGR03986 family CRISPR-associated RAMP protein [Virgibacillus chiguensis]SHH47469.1 CRISPR-associated protein [Virgibacillus chiguensis]
MSNKQQNERFVNPYNFVPLENKCDKEGNRIVGPLTGKIECTLETLSPVFIPDGQDKETFFHYPEDEKPVIPGSEIRGTIRSVFEAAFNGCLSQVNEDPFHRRSMDAKHPGLLYRTDEGWKLKECRKIKTTPYNIQAKSIILSEGDALYSKNNKIFCKKYIPDGKEGFVHLSEKGPNGKPIFVFQPLRKTYKIEQIEIEYLLKVLELYERNNDKNKEHSGYMQYKQKLRNMLMCTDNSIKLPVYYSTDSKGNISHLAPAALSQEVFKNTLIDILKAQGEYQSCECKKAICPACHLFGFVNQQEMQASRIRFSDATIQTEPTFLNKMTLPSLGQPKPGAVEFYTEKNNSYWTYDYTQKGKTRTPLEPSEIKIRGRKFYWHHEPKNYDLKTNMDEMETTIKPLNKGNAFTFTIYFERLTEKELNQLCNVLDINQSKEHAHKIGRGKPLGFGSIQVTIDRIQTRQINENTGAYDLKPDQQRKNMTEDQINQSSDLLKILRYQPDFAKNTVTYPKVEKSSQNTNEQPNDLASHQWFNKNKTRNGFKKVLPTIEEEVSTNSHKWLKINKV